MTLSTPLLAAAPLLAGLLGPALVGAAPVAPQDDRPAARAAAVPATRPGHAAKRDRIVEHVAARTAAEQRRVLDYWTPRRMAAALPIGLLDLVTGDKGLLGGRPGLPLAPAKNEKPPMAIPQAAAQPKVTTVGARWDAGGAVARTTGRVFMTVGGVDFVCSASTVRSANKDVVITAGHCVKDGAGEWAANWTFVPGYGTRGEQPYGRYAARRLFVAEPWSREGDDDYDVGVVALSTSYGRHVADEVGAQEIAFNVPRGGQAFGFGYPADPPYSGGHLVYCAGRLKDDPYGQTRDQGLGCDMTAGSSGGPWLTRFDAATGKGAITSVSSFKYSDDPRTMYGPYLGDFAKHLVAAAERA
jgi:V8-like Glu-specific endopeptidase